MITNRKHEQALQRVRDLAAARLADAQEAHETALEVATGLAERADARVQAARAVLDGMDPKATTVAISRMREALGVPRRRFVQGRQR